MARNLEASLSFPSASVRFQTLGRTLVYGSCNVVSNPIGLPGAANRKCTVRDVAEIISLWPGTNGLSKGLQIKRLGAALWRGFWPGLPA